MHSHPRRIAVLGAGLTGLAAACELRRRSDRQAPAEVVVFEADTRVGGKVRSEVNEGVPFEAGPDCFGTAKPQALELVRELGLGSELLSVNPRHRRLLVLCGGRLKALPAGLGQAVPLNWWPLLASDLLSWKGRLRLLGEPFIPAEEGEADESLAAFLARRLGPEPVARLVDPILAGACLGDPARLSLRSNCPRLADLERRGGLLKGGRGDGSWPATLRGGLRLLPEALARKLPHGCLRLGARVLRLGRRNGGWEVRTSVASEVFDAVVAALPAPDLAVVLEAQDPELAGILREIPFAPAAVVTLAYERRALPHPLDAFGLIVPRSESRRLAGATFSSTKFPGRCPEDLVVVRCLLAPESSDDASAARAARTELREILGLGEAHPRWTRVARWPAAYPQYNVGHALRLRRLESCLQALPGLVLAGESFGGAGLPDCVRSGRLAAAKTLTPAGGRLAAGVA